MDAATADVYDKILSNPKLTGEQRDALTAQRSRRTTAAGEADFRAFMMENEERRRVLEAQEERDALRRLQEESAGTREWGKSARSPTWNGEAALEHMRRARASSELDSVKRDIEKLKASLGLSAMASGGDGGGHRAGKYSAKFEELTAKTIDQQAKAWLMHFVLEYSGRFEEVLDLAEEFRGFTTTKREGELDEQQVHMMLEARGETATVKEFRDFLKTVDIDGNLKVSFLEFLFYEYKKTLADLFEPVGGPVPQELLDALEESISWHKGHWAKRYERDSLYEKLETEAAGGSRVKSLRAQAQLKAERSRGWTQQWRVGEITGGAKTRKADKTIKSYDHTEELAKAVAEENARLAKLEAEAEQRMQDERRVSRAKLKAKAALWQ